MKTRPAGLSLALLATLLAAGWLLPAAGQGQDAATGASPAAQTAPAAPATSAAPTAPAYAGSELCGACHEDLSRDFRRNPHYAVETKGRAGRWKGQACESCHGPGQQHAETAEAPRIFSFTKATADRANQTCLHCHLGQETQHGRLLGAHNRNSLSCVECHSVHKSAVRPLLKKPVEALCSGCHLDVRAAFNRPFRHRLPEKAMGCTDCHNPHGEGPPAGLHRVSGPDVACLKCHGDKRGPFPFEHAPVRIENCSTCHEPHGSANPRMLIRAEVSRLCLECHSNLATGLGVVPPAFHDIRTARFQNCTICHSKIHGSFVSREFLR